MTKIKNVSLYNLYSGNGRPALGLNIRLSGEIEVFSSLVLPLEKNSPLDYRREFQEKLLPFLLELEIDREVSLGFESWLKEQAVDFCPKILSLLVSVGLARAAAKTLNKEFYQLLNEIYGFLPGALGLPTPLINMFNGGRHADTNLDFEEFLLVPFGKNHSSFAEKIAAASVIFHSLADKLLAGGFDTDLGSFGGYAPDMVSDLEAIDCLVASSEQAGFVWGEDFGLGLDIGATSLSVGHGRYLFGLENSNLLTNDLIHLYEEWQKQYNLIYLEDPFAPVDNAGWKQLGAMENQKMILAGDQLFANSEAKFRSNLKNRLANAVVIKPSEFSVLGEVAALMKLAHEHNYQTIISAGDEETTDSFLADLAVAGSVEFIKAGAMARGERNSKLNRLLEIEQDLAN